MEHFYKDLVGWVRDGDLEFLKLGVENTPDGGRIVEIGTCNGYCTAYLIVEIINSGKNIELITCDIFEDESQMQRVKETFKDYKVEILQSRSLDLDIKETDFVWLDGDHSFETVYAELNKFYPILKEGGIIGGHDYLHPTYPEVGMAVRQFCKKLNKEINEVCYSFYFVK
jgi:predicted O-methyltransferase YrrM